MCVNNSYFKFNGIELKCERARVGGKCQMGEVKILSYKNEGSEKGVPWRISGFGFAGPMSRLPIGRTYNEMFLQSIARPTVWRCRACGKHVTNRWHHFQVHTGQRFPCPYCTANYSRIDTVRGHVRTKHRDMLPKGTL
uniref:Fru_4 protein n=1 Tax=Fopius arisanus TaxID=64838 RepID=A0A0C9R3E5_9HYME